MTPSFCTTITARGAPFGPLLAIQKNGLGKIINIETINSSADLLDIINEMEQNTIYVDNIRRLKKHLSHLITFCDFIDRLER